MLSRESVDQAQRAFPPIVPRRSQPNRARTVAVTEVEKRRGRTVNCCSLQDERSTKNSTLRITERSGTDVRYRLYRLRTGCEMNDNRFSLMTHGYRRRARRRVRSETMVRKTWALRTAGLFECDRFLDGAAGICECRESPPAESDIVPAKRPIWTQESGKCANRSLPKSSSPPMVGTSLC